MSKGEGEALVRSHYLHPDKSLQHHRLELEWQGSFQKPVRFYNLIIDRVNQICSGFGYSVKKNCCQLYLLFKKPGGRSQDGGGIGGGDHFLFYKFIERTTER